MQAKRYGTPAAGSDARSLLLAVLLASLLSGCSQKQPMLSGGKPVAYWLGTLKSPDAKLRRTAVFKLGNVGPADPAAFPAVVGALADRDAGVRGDAVLALVKFGDRAGQAQAKLADMEKRDTDAKVRAYAARACKMLQGIGRTAPPWPGISLRP